MGANLSLLYCRLLANFSSYAINFITEIKPPTKIDPPPAGIKESPASSTGNQRPSTSEKTGLSQGSGLGSKQQPIPAASSPAKPAPPLMKNQQGIQPSEDVKAGSRLANRLGSANPGVDDKSVVTEEPKPTDSNQGKKTFSTPQEQQQQQQRNFGNNPKRNFGNQQEKNLGSHQQRNFGNNQQQGRFGNNPQQRNFGGNDQDHQASQNPSTSQHHDARQSADENKRYGNNPDFNQQQDEGQSEKPESPQKWQGNNRYGGNKPNQNMGGNRRDSKPPPNKNWQKPNHNYRGQQGSNNYQNEKSGGGQQRRSAGGNQSGYGQVCSLSTLTNAFSYREI